MNIGLFGGTFDPPHTGHLIVAQDALSALGLDAIAFVPAANPPHKRDTVISPAELRTRMLELALAGDGRFGIERLELERPGPSYTIDTLRELATRQPEVRWTLLIGADLYAEFRTWRDPAGIRRLARVAVLARPGGHGMQDPASLAAADLRVDVTRIDISATDVRRRVAAGLPIRYLVPAAVEKFISEQRLYGRNGTQLTG